MKVYVVMKDGADRPYVSTKPPDSKRRKALLADGCELFEVDIEIPGWEWQDGRVSAVAKKSEVE